MSWIWLAVAFCTGFAARSAIQLVAVRHANEMRRIAKSVADGNSFILSEQIRQARKHLQELEAQQTALLQRAP